jgi:uncharacterized protein YbjT (DUF2867 family)
MTMIVVIGGRSRTGQELIRLLRAAGAPLRILTRSGEKADDPDAMPGDLAKPDTLDAAMAGADQVFLLCSATHDELAWHRNAIDAAVRAGAGHLVRSSILGADPASPARFLRRHGQADQLLRDSGVPHTILRPNMYMHNVSAVWPPSLSDDGSYHAPAGDARISMVDARDVAAVATRALLEDGHLGMAYDVTGPQALSHAEACTKLAAALGRPVRYIPVDDETARSAMLGAGLNPWMADALIELYQDYRRPGADAHAARVSDAVRVVTGALPRTLDQALADSFSPAAPPSPR